jgi:hypothetical protein
MQVETFLEMKLLYQTISDVAPNAANNDYLGVIKVTSSNGINIGGDYTVSGWLQFASTGADTFSSSVNQHL